MAYDPILSYAISNKKSGKALSVETGGAAHGSHVIPFEYVPAEDQLWHIVEVDDGYDKLNARAVIQSRSINRSFRPRAVIEPRPPKRTLTGDGAPARPTIEATKRAVGSVILSDYRSSTKQSAMDRRAFIGRVAGGLLTTPLSARAQGQAIPTIGFLRTTPSGPFADLVAAFRQGLNDTGFVEGQNVAVEYRWADNHLDRLPGLAADLVRRHVAVIVGNSLAAEAAKAVTTTIPIPRY